MKIPPPIYTHRKQTKDLAKSLLPKDIYKWLITSGYFPESYVLPPCFQVTKYPVKLKQFYPVTNNWKPPITECIEVHFPKMELTDRRFGIIDPRIHNDIAFHLAKNWKTIVNALIPEKSLVTSYSFPIAINAKTKGRIGELRSGRMIYEFLDMTEDDLASVAYEYKFLIQADIKNFYASIYTHSIAWAIHDKRIIRKGNNRRNYHKYVGNKLDKLFQNANDGCTIGIPIGSVASDLIGEIIASGVDVKFTNLVEKSSIDCVAVRFKDDYRLLAKTEEQAKKLIKLLQIALKEFNLELNDEKTKIYNLPDGLFRKWASKYHAIQPRPKTIYSWKEFKELYLAVIEIDKECPGTGVIDRFLADIVDKERKIKFNLYESDLDKAISMLLMLGTLRVKAFPKIMGIMESIFKNLFGQFHKNKIFNYLENYLCLLAEDEERNKYLITWVIYFLVSNGFKKKLSYKFKDVIVKSVASSRSSIFSDATDFKIFSGVLTTAKKLSMLEHLDIFEPTRTNS